VVIAVIVGKFISAIAAVLFAYLMCKMRGIGEDTPKAADATEAPTEDAKT
jgi:hypothetical protein